jgi:hypothetical protein
MSLPSPRIAAALADSLSVPPGLAAFLSRIERELEEARARMDALPRPALASVEDVRAELERALGDDERGALSRMLRRPLWQLDTRSQAVRAFGKFCRELLARAEAAIHLQVTAETAAASLRELRDRYEPRLPTLGPALVRASGAAEEDLRRVRKPADVQVFRARLARAARQLEELAADLPAELPLAEGDGPDGRADDVPTPGEFWVLLQRRLRERARAIPRRSLAAAAELATARQLEVLAGTRGGARARRSSHLVAEQLGIRAAETAQSGLGSDAGDLWTALVAAATAAVHDPGAPDAWLPALRFRPRPADTLSTVATLFVVPIGGRWVYLTPAIPSAVRLFSLSADVGKPVQARVFGAGSELPWELAQMDLAPLFSGIEDSTPGWYGTERAVTMIVEARVGEGWFGGIQEEGRVRRLEAPAWDPEAGRADAVRVLPPPARIDAPGGVDVGTVNGPEQVFLWHRTRPVRAPFRHDPEAWLRYGDGSAAAEDALERERLLFSRLEGRSGSLGLRYLARARAADGSAAGLLYARPFGFRPDDSPPLADWLRDRPFSFLRAIAQALVAVHDTGFALGFCHLSMFAFAAGYGGRDADPRPRAVLCTAPYATPLGIYFPALAHGGTVQPLFPNLGFGGHYPWLTGVEVALPEFDALAFAVLALDLLPSSAPAERYHSWQDLASGVGGRAGTYQRPELASRFAAALRDVSRAGAVLELVRALAADPRRKGDPAPS